MLDADGAVVVEADRVDDVAGAARERDAREGALRARYAAGSARTTSTTCAGSSKG